MISGDNDVLVRMAVTEDLERIKLLADSHKSELGFLIRGAIRKSIDNHEVYTADHLSLVFVDLSSIDIEETNKRRYTT